MSDHDTDDVFEDRDEPTLLDELGAFDEPTRTIIPAMAASERTLQMRDGLPGLSVKHSAQASAESSVDYRILGTLGEGGMGVISLAEQTALRREVAVKAPKDDDDWLHARVLEEALVMGRMEHPNVVPAYGLGRGDAGQPLLVMKRVEGVDWDGVLGGWADAPGDVEVDLEWHLRVLLQVCNALRFAHSRHVVHRDIKPENVMIGEFGEVYLLDWGIALSLDEEATEGFPTRETSQGLAGTPAFMAPEMTSLLAVEIDERTDVYLLGATLHVILMGEPPHKGEDTPAVLRAARRSEPFAYPRSVPSGLAVIAHRAMAKHKDERFESVAAFAAALEEYLAHRASHMLSDAAHATLAAALEGERGDVDFTVPILESEFGFRHALTIWSGNAAAARGLQSAVEARAWACIHREEIAGARAALEQLPEQNPDLTEALAELELKLSSRAERVAYLERFERDLDLTEGMAQRQRAVFVFGFTFTALCWAQAWAYYGVETAGAQDLVGSFVRLLAIAVMITALFHKQLFRNVANRRLIAFFWSTLIFILTLRIAAASVEASALYEQVAEICVLGMAGFAIGVNTSARLTAASLGYGVAAVVGAMSGQLWVALAALGTQHVLYFGAMAWIWRPPR